MLNFIYYPVSAILWFWHKVFGTLLGDSNGFAWALSVTFLVFTLRALLIKPFISQVRSMRKMQEFQPQIKKLQEKYKGDRQKLAEEMQKLQKEHGVNPLGGCLPVLVQLPVFIGLFHVLRGFQPAYPYNYVFNRQEILSFLDADILGVKLSDSIAGGAQALGHFSLSSAQFNPNAIVVALPLMIVASVATHFTARVSQAHQSQASAANPQAAIMGKLTMWLFPVGVLVFGAFFPVAILLYWLSNNTWTLTQQFLVYRKIDSEEQAMRDQARDQRDLLAPRPGAKPARSARTGPAGTAGSIATEVEDAPADTVLDDAAPAEEPVEASSRAATVDGRRHPGKVGSAGNGTAKNGATKNASAKNGAGKNGSGRAPGKPGGGKGQLAASGRPGGKKAKKRR